MQKLLKQVHSENHTMVTVASPNDDFICPLCRKKVLCCDSFVHYKLDMAVPMTAQV